MSMISQIAIILLIFITAVIILYANKGLQKAEMEGEHFVDEWAMKQQKRAEMEKKLRDQNAGNARPPQELPPEEHLQPGNEAMPGEKTVRGKEPVRKKPDGTDELWEAKRASGNIRRKTGGIIIPMYQRRESLIRLTMMDEHKKVVRTIDVDHYPFRIGRDPSNDLVLDDIYIARKHFVILEENGRILIRNLGSMNRIFAEGRQWDEYMLYDKCHFYLGGYEFSCSEQKHRSQPTVMAPGRERMSM